MVAYKLGVALAAVMLGIIGLVASTNPVVTIGQASLPEAVVVRGRILDGISQKPIRHVVVSLAKLTVDTEALAFDAKDLSSAVTTMRSTLTDESGVFEFKGLTRGKYSLAAFKAGYASAALGQLVPETPSRHLVVSPPAVPGSQDLVMWKTAAIEGRVRDETGAPIVGALVRALRQRNYGNIVSVGVAGFARTDDQGTYRLFGLLPGDYLVALWQDALSSPLQPMPEVPLGLGALGLDFDSYVDPAAIPSLQAALYEPVLTAIPAGAITFRSSGYNRSMDLANGKSFAPSFYPGVSEPQNAVPLRLGAASDRSGVDIRLTRRPAFVVSGTALGTDGRPVPGALVELRQSWASDIVGSRPLIGQSRTDSSGKFQLYPITSGPYTISVESLEGQAAPPGASSGHLSSPGRLLPARGASGSADVEVVDRSVSLTLVVQPMATLSGEIVIDGLRRGLTAPEQLALRFVIRNVAIPQSPDPLRAAIHPGAIPFAPDTSGRFQTPPLKPGRYLIDAVSSGTLVLQSAGLGQADLGATGIEVSTEDRTDLGLTLSSAAGRIRGAVKDSFGNPAGDTIVVIYTDERTVWNGITRNSRYRAVLTASDGTFDAQGFAPGGYYVGSVSASDFPTWYVADRLATLAATATHVTLATESPLASVSLVRRDKL